jgi:hypothetical protein
MKVKVQVLNIFIELVLLNVFLKFINDKLFATFSLAK